MLNGYILAQLNLLILVIFLHLTTSLILFHIVSYIILVFLDYLGVKLLDDSVLINDGLGIEICRHFAWTTRNGSLCGLCIGSRPLVPQPFAAIWSFVGNETSHFLEDLLFSCQSFIGCIISAHHIVVTMAFDIRKLVWGNGIRSFIITYEALSGEILLVLWLVHIRQLYHHLLNEFTGRIFN